MPEYEPLLTRLEATRVDLFRRRWLHGTTTHARLMTQINQDIENVLRLMLCAEQGVTPRVFCCREYLRD